MDRTEQTVRRTFAAVDAPLYDIGILSDRGMFPRMDALTAAQCIARLRYLKYRNANGAHIYFRPSGERRFTLLDDISRDSLSNLAAQGFEPCAVIENQPQQLLSMAQTFARPTKGARHLRRSTSRSTVPC